MKTADINVLTTTELEDRVRASVYSDDLIKDYLKFNSKDIGGNFKVPIVESLVEFDNESRTKELEKKLLSLYEDKFMFADTEDIDKHIKLIQASAMDGIIIGVNYAKDCKLELYTANPSIIFGEDVESKFTLEKTLGHNRNGVINAVRIDVEYHNEGSYFSYKLVNMRSDTLLYAVNPETSMGKYHFIPFVVMKEYSKFFKDLLNDGRTIEVIQESGSEIYKRRYITTNSNMLKKYSDDTDFISGLKPVFFPLSGYFYAPVLGADSLSLGLTRINFVDVVNITLTSDPKGVKKAIRGGALEDSIIVSMLENMVETNREEYIKLVGKLPKINNISTGNLNNADLGVVSPRSVGVFYRGSSEAIKGKVKKLIPGCEEEFNKYNKLFTCYKKEDIEGFTDEDISALLKDGIYSVKILKDNCLYSSMVVTNSRDILKQVYGNDYFGKYESFGSRLYELERLAKKDGTDNLEGMLSHCGFKIDEDSKEGILQNIKSTLDTDDGETHNLLSGILGEGTEKINKSSYGKGGVTCRGLTAVRTDRGITDYYKRVDIGKVISITKIGNNVN